MKHIYLTTIIFITASCIPLKIAPDYKDGKVLKGTKFIKNLKSQNVFAFNDPKDANEFYTYISEKFQIVYDDDLGNIPVKIAGKTMYLTFYEAEKTTKTFNIFPMVVDVALNNANVGPVLENHYTSRTGNWYIVMTLTDTAYNDALNEKHKNHNSAVAFLQALRKEYLVTAQYTELKFLTD